jgi:hypothetical protein
MIHDRYDDPAALLQRPADLDLLIAPATPAAQPEDPPRSRRTARDTLRALAQLTVRLLGTLAAGIDARDEEPRHLRRAADDFAG